MSAQKRRHPTIPIPPLPKFTLPLPSSSAQQGNYHVPALNSPLAPLSGKGFMQTQDYSRWPPDELFARMGVSEVKGVHARLRADADAKQEELRTMVGERYRDLLQASTSIITISTESQRVVTALADVKDASAADDPASVQVIPRQPTRKAGIDEADLGTLQSLSAHLKLLLDAPEQLWRLLEGHNYLHAAWLFLISRVVYRSLMRDDFQDEDDLEVSWRKSEIRVSEQFPLAHRQWEAISQFRSQISHKATQSLRISPRTSKDICNTLVAILLLDSIPVSETVTLFLTQRSKALRSLLAKLYPVASATSQSGHPRAASPSSMSKQSNGIPSLLKPIRSLSRPQSVAHDVDSPKSKSARKEIVAATRGALTQGLDLITSTVETMRAIYIGGNSSEKPLVEQVLESVQGSSESPSPIILINGTKKRSRHASRLSIISSFHATPTPLPPFHHSSITSPTDSSFEPLTTATILEALPSFHLLLQFLPPSIVSYSPYIDTLSASAQLSSKADINAASALWFEASLRNFREHLSRCFAGLDTIRAIWETRTVLSAYEGRLTKAEFEKLGELVDEVSKERAREVWTAALDDIVHLAEKLVDDAVAVVLTGDETNIANDPAAFLMAQIPIPTFAAHPITSATVTNGFSAPKPHAISSSMTFSSYGNALQKKIDAVPPLLDQTVAALERAAHRLKKDVDFMTTDSTTRLYAVSKMIDSLLAEYLPQARRTAFKIAQLLSSRVRADPVETLDPLKHEKAMNFLGRLALEIYAESSFISELTQNQGPSESRKEFLDVFNAMLQKWQDITLSRTLDLYSSFSTLAPSLTVEDYPQRASSALTQSLLSLINSVSRLGLPHHALGKYHIPEGLLRGLSHKLSSIDETPGRQQRSWDLAFLQRLSKTFEVKVVANGNHVSYETAPSSQTSDTYSESILGQLIRWQLFLGPLLGPHVSDSLTSTPKNASTKATSTCLLPFGVPSAQEDFTPVVEVVKPGPRFGTLLLGPGWRKTSVASKR